MEKTLLTSLVSFCSETKTNLSVLQNLSEQSGTLIYKVQITVVLCKTFTDANGNILPQWCSQLCKC